MKIKNLFYFYPTLLFKINVFCLSEAWMDLFARDSEAKKMFDG